MANQKKTEEMEPKRNHSCKSRIGVELKSTLKALRSVWKANQEGKEEGDPKYGRFQEYGLCFGYVAPDTFGDQKEPYFRYQLSWGGPSDEFRFYASKDRRTWMPYRIEYWFMDWYDGAHRVLGGENLKLMEDIFSWFDGAGITDSEYQKAMAE